MNRKSIVLQASDKQSIWSRRRQLEYARHFHRITDNSKALALTGSEQKDMMPLYEGLK